MPPKAKPSAPAKAAPAKAAPAKAKAASPSAPPKPVPNMNPGDNIVVCDLLDKSSCIFNPMCYWGMSNSALDSAIQNAKSADSCDNLVVAQTCNSKYECKIGEYWSQMELACKNPNNNNNMASPNNMIM